MRVVSLLLVALLALAAPALAQNSNGSFSPGVTQNSATATGGAGGAGGTASSSASATGGIHTQTNTQLNTQVNSQTAIQGQHQGQHQGQQQGQIQGQGQGQKQSANNEGISISTDVPAQAPAIFAPNLTSSPEACMGSVSAGGGAGFGGTSFGITFGTTWTNEQCQDRMNARTLSSLGQNQAALEYLAASNPKIATALKQAGVKVAALEIPTIPNTTLALNTPLGAAAPVVLQGGAKIEKQDVAQVAAELPACGDGKPAKLKPSGIYTCAMYR